MAENTESTKPKDGPRKCEACGITLPDIYAYADHLESKEHTKGVMKKKYGEKYLDAKAVLLGTKTEKEIKSNGNKSNSSDEDEEDDVYTCLVCRKVCTGNLNYQLHLSGKSHEKNVKKQKLLKQMKKDKLIEDNDAPAEDRLIDGLFSQSQSSSSELVCKVCNKKCSGPEAFKQHTNSESHKKKLAMQSLIKDIPYRKRSTGNPESDDDEVIRCDICCKEFSGPLPYKQHMDSPSHLKQVKVSEKLLKIKDLVISSENSNRIQCKECNKYFSGPKPFNDHLKSSLHSKMKQRKDLLNALKEKYSEMIVQSDLANDSDDSEKEDTTIFCSVCHVAFSGPESARDHFQSQKHKKVLKEKMRHEKYKQLKNNKKSDSKIKSKEDEIQSDSSDDFDIVEEIH